MVFTAGVRLIVAIEESVLFVVPVDVLVIELLDAYQVSVKAWYKCCSCEQYLPLAVWVVYRDCGCTISYNLFCMRARIELI